MRQAGVLLCCISLLSFTAFGGEGEYLYYHGDIHSHTGYSDGPELSTPADAYAHARDVAGLDFYCVTDHFCPDDPEWGMQPAEYEQMKVDADAADRDGVFTALYGYEWTKDDTHANVFMASDFIPDDNVEDFYSELFERRLVDKSIFGKFNHPAINECSDWDDWAFSSKGAWCMSLMEVRSAFPPELSRGDLTGEILEYAEAIEHGWLVGVDGSKDTHDDTWGEFGINEWEKFNTVALATGLTREEIIDALQMRRTYVSQDTDFRTNPLEVELRASNDGGMTYPYIMGEALDLDDASFVDLRLMMGEGGTDYLHEARIYKNGNAVVTETGVHSLDHTVAYTDTSPAHGDYYFAFVTEEDGEVALTSAIFVRNGDTDADGLSDEDEINTIGTNPSYHDTDGDGFSDGDEVAAGSDPLDPNDYPVPVTPTVAPSATPTPTSTPTGTPLPIAENVLNSTELKPGDHFDAQFMLHESIERPFTAFAVIIMPNGNMLNALTLDRPITPVAKNVPSLSTPFSYLLLSTAVPQGAPKGTYEVVTAFFYADAPIRSRSDAFLEASASFAISE